VVPLLGVAIVALVGALGVATGFAVFTRNAMAPPDSHPELCWSVTWGLKGQRTTTTEGCTQCSFEKLRLSCTSDAGQDIVRVTGEILLHGNLEMKRNGKIKVSQLDVKSNWSHYTEHAPVTLPHGIYGASKAVINNSGAPPYEDTWIVFIRW
jgi:hypothetical protein